MSEPIESIGQILEGDYERDAIHIAVMPVILDEDLRPGCPLRIVFGTENHVVDAYTGGVGILDPFLRGYEIRKGSKCWMFLYPNSITGLRHNWHHPLIDKPITNMSEAEKWLRNFASRWNFNYDEMIAAATNRDDDDHHYVTAGGIDLHSAGELGEDHDLFWEHLEKLTNEQFDEHHRNSFIWSCSC